MSTTATAGSLAKSASKAVAVMARTRGYAGSSAVLLYSSVCKEATKSASVAGPCKTSRCCPSRCTATSPASCASMASEAPSRGLVRLTTRREMLVGYCRGRPESASVTTAAGATRRGDVCSSTNDTRVSVSPGTALADRSTTGTWSLMSTMETGTCSGALVHMPSNMTSSSVRTSGGVGSCAVLR